MKKNSVGSFRKKAVLTRKTAMAATSIVLALALIATVAFGLIPDTAIKASADTIGLISSASGKNYLPDTYTPVNVPAGTYGMTEDEYKNGLKPHESDGVAAFDFHIFAKNFASKAHTCGNIAVENLGGSAAGASGAPEFGSRPNHDTNSIKLSYVENIHDWSTSAQADAFVFGPNNTVTEKSGQVFVNTPNGKYMMGNGKQIMDKTYIDDATPFIDIDKELQDAEDYQRYLVWLMDDIRTRGEQYYVDGWGIAMPAQNGETVRVLTHPDVAGWGWFGTTIDFSKYPEDTIIVDLDLYQSQDWWTGQTSYGSNAQNLINGSVTLKGTAGKRIIFNVESSSGFNADCIKFADTNMKADQMGNSEDSVKLDNNILWNFYNKDSGVPQSTSGTITVGGTWMGTILAPDATVKCGAGLNGSIIAKEVTTSAETHKSDYTGEKVTKSDTTSITLTKIWQDNPATRPDFITIKLLQNNKAYKTVQLSAADCVVTDKGFQWEYTFTDLPVTDGRGVSYRYDLEEVVPKGYTSNVVNNMIINSTKEGRQENEEPKLATLTFNKRAEGKPAEFLKGAQFKMTIDNGSSLAEVTAVSGVENFKATDGEVTWTSTDAAAVFANLPYGTYTITETKAPAGYLTANPVTVKVDAETAKADMNDKPVEIKLAKLESVNNDMLPGAELKLTADWGQDLSGVEVTGAKMDTVNKSANSITWTSDKGVVTIKGIAPGSYTLSETKAPMGYDIAAPVTFIVENDGTVKVNGQAKSRVEMIDTLTPEKEPEPVYYNITINKVNEAKNVSLPGAKLQLTAVGNIELDGVTVTGAKDGTVAKSGNTITWETNGSAVSFGNLPEGSYTLSEISAPEGYKTASPMTFTVSANGSYEMIDKAIEMSISKKDAASGAELAGATLTLTSKEGKSLAGVTVTGADKKDNSAISMPDSTITWTTDGRVVSFSGLPAGNYTLSESETGVPVGYKRAADIEFKVDAYGNVSGTNVSGNTCTMYDEPVIVEIEKEFYNKGNTGALSGAVLQLTGTSDMSHVSGSIPVTHVDANTITWTSGSAANKIRGLVDGTYTLHEISAPESFDIAEDIVFTVEGGKITEFNTVVLKDKEGNTVYGYKNGTGNHIMMTDCKTPFYSLDLTKIDKETEKAVAGAVLAVFDKDAKSFTADEAILKITSTEEAQRLMLEDGDYVLVELEAPEGYDKTDEKIYFNVNNGTLKVTKLDKSELAVATKGSLEDAGLSADREDCFFTLETTEIFQNYGEFPEAVSFTLGEGLVCTRFTLYEETASGAKPLVDVTETNPTEKDLWSYNIAEKVTAAYNPDHIYYAVLDVEKADGTPASDDEVGNIRLNFSYPEEVPGEVKADSKQYNVGSGDGLSIPKEEYVLTNGNAAGVFPETVTFTFSEATVITYFQIQMFDSKGSNVGGLYALPGSNGNVSVAAGETITLPFSAITSKEHVEGSNYAFTISMGFETSKNNNTNQIVTIKANYPKGEGGATTYAEGELIASGVSKNAKISSSANSATLIDITDFCESNGKLPNVIEFTAPTHQNNDYYAHFDIVDENGNVYKSYKFTTPKSSSEKNYTVYDNCDGYQKGTAVYTSGAKVYIKPYLSVDEGNSVPADYYKDVVYKITDMGYSLDPVAKETKSFSFYSDPKVAYQDITSFCTANGLPNTITFDTTNFNGINYDLKVELVSANSDDATVYATYTKGISSDSSTGGTTFITLDKTGTGEAYTSGNVYLRVTALNASNNIGNFNINYSTTTRKENVNNPEFDTSIDMSDVQTGTFVESDGGITAFVKLPNAKTPITNLYSVKLTKTTKPATEGTKGETITNNPASFQLFDSKDKLVENLVYVSDGVYEYQKDAAEDTWANVPGNPLKTGADGTLTINYLNEGKYNFYEVEAPKNFELSSDPVSAVINTTHTPDNPKEVTAVNEALKGHITLIKTDENGTLKEGATFELYRVKLEDINSSTPTASTPIGTYTTLNDGKYTVEVELGYLYYAIETVNGAPSGTVNSNVDVKLPKLDTNGPDASRYVINGNNVNYGIVLAEDIGSGNVKLQVASGIDENNSIIYADQVAYEVVTDANGNPVYKVDENGNTIYKVDGNGNPTDIPVPELKAAYMDVYDGSIGAVNTSVKTTINKFDADGQTPLAGAVLKLEKTDVTAGKYSKPVFGEVKGSIDVTHYIEYVYDEDANGDLNLSINTEDKNERPFIQSEYITWTSGDAANVLAGLPAGTYRLTELDAPEGYAVAQPKDFTVGTADGSVDMIDTKLTGSITLTKRDSVNNARIADVQFMLQVSDDGKAWTDTGKTYTTKADGTVTADGLTYGKYYRFKEISTPAGYKANEGEAIYTTSAQVTEDKLTSTVDFENTALTGSVTLTKVEKGNADVKLANAEFQLYYKASTANDSTYILYSDETYTTDANGQIKVENLPWGYTYRFKETKAPTGYAIDSEDSTAVALTADDLIKSVTVENIKIVGAITLTGTKTIEGKDNVTQTFEFIVKEGDKTVATANNVGGTITFPAINYTAADIGDHTYKISESKYDADGIKSTDTVFTVTVNVALSQDGKSLVATIKDGSQNIAFVNTYTAEGVEATVNGTKTLEGKALTDGAFTFELYETGADFNISGKTPQTTTNVNGAFSFTKAYDEAGTHYYVIKEQIPSETNGITYDTAEYRWTVVVKDNGTGAFVIESETLTKGGAAATSADFTNTYSTTAIGESVSGTKTLAGNRPEALKENEFTFELWNEDETTKITEVKNAANGTFSFSQNYTAAGTYSYVIKEQIPADTKGITYDTAEYVWTVVVKDNGTGALVVESETLTKGGETATSADFTNTYSATAISESVSGTKTLAGDRPEALEADEFTFGLWNADETEKITETKNAANGAFSFSQNYTAAGTYSYVIKEQIPSETNGITYDTAEYIWTVVVTDNGTGKLVVTSETLTKGGTTATSADFTNTYSTTAVSESVSGTKTLAGGRPEALKNGEFTFELWNADETAKITGVTNAADGTFTITQTYTAAGTYSYVIKEQIPANTNGITYDTAEYVWTVVVKDNGTGALVVDSETLTKDGKTATSADFTNTYSATAVSESVSGTKTLAGGRPEALKENEFTFELWNADETTKITDVKNAADGSFSISQNYTAAGTYSYVIKEQIPAKTNGIAYDEAEYVWTVVVKDNGTGKLVVDSETLTKGGKTATSADFTNTYSATATSESVDGVKTLAGSRPEALKENEFTFELWNADETTKITETKNAANGAFSFTQEYTAAGTYSYVIKEQIPSDTNGIDYDEAEYVWTVVVKDNGTGALVVESETLTKGGETAASADFTNTYSAQSVKATVDGLKNLDGAPTSKEFTFELWAADKDKKITGTQAIATFTNGADGTFVIETEEFTAPGTHYFVVKEQIPAGAVNNVYNGVTYDTTEYFWTVTITDNGSGNLVASKTVNQDGSEAVYTFNNTTATGTVSISKQKVGGGKDIDGAVLSIEPVGDITFGSGITVSAAVKTVTESNITWTSEKEEVSITGLPVGTYALTETVAPDGYALSEETIYFKIADDGKIYSVTEAEYKTDGTTEWKEVTDSTVIMEDAPYTSVFSKVDADLGGELPGATVTITPTAFADLSNVVLPDDVRIVEGAITWTSTTEPKTIGALPDGVYEFKEVQAPYGYAIAEVVYVKIDGDNVYSATKAEYDAEGFDWSEVTAAEGDRVIMEDAVNKAVFSKRAADGGNELVGAILKITALDEGVTLDRVPEVSGVSLIESGKTLTWISDGTEKTIGQLPNGVYEFTEIAAPSGYAPAETIYVKIDNGNVYSATKAEYNNGKIDWSKVTAADGDRVIMVDALNTATFSKTDTDAGDELPGAIINIVPVVSGTDLSEVAKNAPDHVTVEDGIISWESGTEPTVLKKLPDGEYKFIEITAPSGYEVAETIYFKVENGAVSSVPAADYDGEDTEWVAANGNKVIMKDAPNTLVLSKQATGAGEELAGAELSLTPVTSGTDISGVKVPTGVDNKDNKITWLSKKDAPLTLNMVPDGIYKFTEDKAPLGYELAETIYIKVENGDIFSVAEKNYAGEDTLWGRAAELDTVLMLDDPTPEPNKVNFSFIKYSNIGTTVSGATFTLTGPNDFSASSTSNGTGGVAFTGLGEGVYTLLESACPPSYVKSEQIVYISVDAEGVISYKDATGKDIVHSDIETLMTNKIKPIEDEKKGNVGDVYNLYEQLLKEYKEYEDITITWESSDSSIIEVDQNGKATIKKVGQATITAKNGDTVLGTFVLGAEAVNGTEDETPNTGDTDAPQTGDVTTGWTIAVVSLLGISAIVAKVSYDKIKRNAKNKAVR